MTARWGQGRPVMLFANTEWYLFNFRLPLAQALREAGFAVLLVSPPGPYGDTLGSWASVAPRPCPAAA